MCRGIPIDSDFLGVDAIRDVGPDGNFLTHPHTLKHMRATQWRPRLISRAGFEKWQAAGETTLMERAREQLARIRAGHRPIPIDPEIAATIQALVDRYDP
jgi:trimethylamine--corrinoid protein Co-methyltransferase